MLRLLLSHLSLGILPLALTSAGALADSNTAASSTWVITDRWHPVRGEAERLIELDAPARIETELFSRLSSDPGGRRPRSGAGCVVGGIRARGRRTRAAP